MSKEANIKLKQVLDNNRKWPIIIEGLKSSELKSCIILSAKTTAMQLHQSATVDPLWIHEIMQKPETRFLIVDGLDDVDFEKQADFEQLLKDRQAGFYRLPDTMQIVIPVADLDKVSKKIQSLSLIWKHRVD